MCSSALLIYYMWEEDFHSEYTCNIFNLRRQLGTAAFEFVKECTPVFWASKDRHCKSLGAKQRLYIQWEIKKKKRWKLHKKHDHTRHMLQAWLKIIRNYMTHRKVGEVQPVDFPGAGEIDSAHVRTWHIHCLNTAQLLLRGRTFLFLSIA